MQKDNVYLSIHIFFLALSLFSVHLAGAQPSKTFGKFELLEFSPDMKGEYDRILPDSSCFVYVVSNSQNPKKTYYDKIHANVHNCEFNYVNTLTFSETQQDLDNYFGKVFFIHARHDLIAVSLNVVKQSITVRAEGLKHITGLHELHTFEVEGRVKARILDCIASPDSNQFAVILEVKTEDDVQSFVVSFDGNLEETGQYQINHHQALKSEHYMMNNSGDVLAFECLQSDNKNEKDKYYTFNFYSLKSNKVEKCYGADQIKDVFRSYQGSVENGIFFNIILLSHTYDKKEMDKKQDAGASENDQYQLSSIILDENFHLQSETKNKIAQSYIDGALKGDKIKLLSNFTLAGMFKSSNGSLLVIGDANQSGVYVNHSGNAIPYFHHNGILIFNISKEGLLVETKLIERSETTNWGPLLELVPVAIHDGMFFSYFASKEETYLVKVFLDENDKITLMKKKISREVLGKRDIMQDTMVSDGDHTVYVNVDFAFKSISLVKIETD